MQRINDDHHNRHALAKTHLRDNPSLAHTYIEEGWDNQSKHSQHQHGAVQGGSPPVKFLNTVLNAPQQYTEAQYQQQIADNGPGDSSFDQIEQTLFDSKDGDD